MIGTKLGKVFELRQESQKINKVFTEHLFELARSDVVFIGVSVDKEKDLEKWKKFIVDEQLPGVQLFAGGWSKITQDYKITGIPRFMVFGKDGSIVESNAPRPSNPALKKMLEAELKK